VQQYDAIPEELKWCRQWCIAGPDKAPYVAGKKGISRASVTHPGHWKDFEDTVEGAVSHSECGIGFVLQESDPFCCIDLDVKDATNEPDPRKWSSEAQIARFAKIVGMFNSYTERSRSGRGLHIWVRGKVGPGHRRDGVEIYSQERFIICTGNVYIDKPIAERQALLDIVVAEMGGQESAVADLKEVEQSDSDAALYERAAGAENGSKFLALWGGDWTALGYPSQSEADLALLSIFTFYSKSNEQCRRLFRMSGLGKREKAVKNNVYIDRTLKMIRGRQEAADDIDKATVESAAAIMKSFEQKAEEFAAAKAAQFTATAPAIQTVPPVVLPVTPHVTLEIPEPPHVEKGLEWPPGLVGAIAWYIYQSSPRPVMEVSIVAALGLVAGICGKTFLIPQSGLNVYIVLVARSGVGKEAMHSGISNLMAKIRESVPSVMKFIDFSDFASGPALSKAVAENSSFCNVAGEWGQKLKRLAKENSNDSAMHSLRTTMTNLYQKSGPTSIVGGIGYSDKDKNVASVSGVAYSMIGETTPGVFYESLTESMMEDGFMSRFTVVEYMGDRPPANPTPALDPHPGLVEALCSLCVHSLMLTDRYQTQAVARSPDAAKMLDAFDKYCDKEINATDNEGWRQMWNRAHLKAYRFAALLAAADNPLNPVITETHCTWALALIKRDIAIIQRRIKAGDVGEGDGQRERKLMELIRAYLAKPIAPSYKISDAVRMDGLIPHRYLLTRVGSHASFAKHRLGLVAALDATIKSLLTCGYLIEVEKSQILEKHGYHGRIYRVVYLPLEN